MKISALVDKVEPFRFEFDGEVVEGEYYKYKTTTPNYAKGVMAQIPEEPNGDGTKQERNAAKQTRVEALNRVGARVLTDTIKSWDAEDSDGNPLPPSYELFNELPAPFTEKLIAFFEELRNPKVNPPTASPSS